MTVAVFSAAGVVKSVDEVLYRVLVEIRLEVKKAEAMKAILALELTVLAVFLDVEVRIGEEHDGVVVVVVVRERLVDLGLKSVLEIAM